LKDTIVDPDRKRRKQVEFLVDSGLLLRQFEEIGIRTAKALGEVDTILAFREVHARVIVRHEWYYN
jgi:hypothetical protein